MLSRVAIVATIATAWLLSGCGNSSSAPEGNFVHRDSKSSSISQSRPDATSDITDSPSPVIKDCRILTQGTSMMLDVSMESGDTVPTADGYALVYSINAKAGISEAAAANVAL